MHHLDGGEHVFIVGTAFVATEAEGHIDAQPPPKKAVGRGAVEDIAVGEVGVGGGFGTDRAVAEGMEHHVAHAGGAVVAEEVVKIVAVLGKIVGFEGNEEVVELLGSEAQALLPHGTALHAVFEHEIIERGAAEAIVETATGEFPIEMGGVEVESAVVVDYVDVVDRVVDADGGVSESGVELVAGATGDEAGIGGVGQTGHGSLLSAGKKREQQKEYGDEKGFSHCGIVLTGLLTRGLGIGFGRIDRLWHIGRGRGSRGTGVGSRMVKMDVHLRERDRDVIAV